jgi:hypothetical protein
MSLLTTLDLTRQCVQKRAQIFVIRCRPWSYRLLPYWTALTFRLLSLLLTFLGKALQLFPLAANLTPQRIDLPLLLGQQRLLGP